jgi:diguanylate cyclase (GGDEF)-like protein/PAS domain S-box-containing protein
MDNDHKMAPGAPGAAADSGTLHAWTRRGGDRAPHALHPGQAGHRVPATDAWLAARADAPPADPSERAGFVATPGDAGAREAAAAAQRQRAEREQDYYHALYLLAPVGYFLLAFDSAILQVNLVGADMLGIARADARFHRFRSFIGGAFLADFDTFVSAALNSTQALSCQLQMAQFGDGAALPVSLHASADGSGQACRVVVEHAEGKLAALERSEERFRRIVHTAEEGIWEIDAAATTSFVNPKMAQILGYSIEEMLGTPVSAFMDDEGRVLLEQNIARRQQGIAERHEFKFIGKDGRQVWTTMATNPIVDASGHYQGALALVTDITERKQSSERIWHQANYDALTGLPNRHMFGDRLAQEARKADRGAHFLALLFIDLDHFKQVNDRHGHALGDALLQETARRVQACVRGSDTLARLGGDEFTVILSGLDHAGSIDRIAAAMVEALARPFVLGDERVFISASIGIALYPPDAADTVQLLAHADQAMYASKHAGRNRFSYFTPDLQDAADARRTLAAELREAIALQQFELLYQPIVSLQTGAVRQAEALLRWRHPTRGLLGPAEFIPFAESNGLIVEIGDWVFRQAAAQVQQWQALIDPAFQISVNKSPLQFRHDAEQYRAWLDFLTALGLPPGSIVIEVSESVLHEGVAKVVERLRQFRAMGLQVALDDFGTGYASLSHLKRFEIDVIKIDQSFVATLEDDNGDLALCEAIIAMAHKLGLKVVAEGVETKVQRALLVDAGCDYAQGYIFARPMAAAEFEAMARAGIPRLPH